MTTPGTKQRPTAWRRENFAELRTRGLSVARAAERLGVTDRTGWRYEAVARGTGGSMPTLAIDYLPAWKGTGLCAGQPHLMYDPEQALDLCRACPVLHACRDWVLSIPIHEGPDGVVAGLTFVERERILLGRLPPKKCNDCALVKPLYEFAQNSDGKPTRRTICKPCLRQRETRSKTKGTT